MDAAFDSAAVTRTAAFGLSTSDAVVRFMGLGFGATLVPASATHRPTRCCRPRAGTPAPSARAFLALLFANQV